MGREDYLKDEEFIWKDLIQQVEKVALPGVREVWKKSRSHPRMLFSWPAEHLITDDGGVAITHLVSFAPPEGMETFRAATALAARTKSYALMLVEVRGEDLKVILESAHGARCWSFPIRRHGDIQVLEKENASTDDEGIGVLWRRVIGRG